MRPRLMLATVLTTLAACGGSGRAAVPTTLAVTLPPTTPTTSSVASSSTVASTPPTTPAATTTTTDPTAEAERLARDAVDRFEVAFATCIRDIATCDTKVFADVASDQQLARTVALIEAAARDGEVVRDSDHYRYVIESVAVAKSGDNSTVTSCNFDARRLVRPNAAPDGTDIVVNDTASTSRYTNDVRRGPDGRWRVADATKIGVDVQGDQCVGQ